MRGLNLLIAMVIATTSIGCNHDKPSANVGGPSAPSDKSKEPRFEIQPGLYSEGQEYDDLMRAMSQSSANIRLDFHSGISWNGNGELKDVNELEPLLKSVANKGLVFVSTGKTAWDKEGEYIDSVSRLVEALGSRMLVVLFNNVLIRSREARLVGWARSMLYSGFITLPPSVVRWLTEFATDVIQPHSVDPTARTLGQSGKRVIARSRLRSFHGLLSPRLLPRDNNLMTVSLVSYLLTYLAFPFPSNRVHFDFINTFA